MSAEEKKTRPVSDSQPASTVTPSEEVSEGDAIEPVIDQTHFAEDVVIEDIQATSSAAETEGAKAPAPWWKTSKGIAGIVIGLLLVMIISLTLVMNLNGQMTPAPDITSESEQGSDAQVSELQRQLLLLEQDIEAADPLESELAFPPVDYSLTLEDALTAERLQELQQNRR